MLTNSDCVFGRLIEFSNRVLTASQLVDVDLVASGSGIERRKGADRAGANHNCPLPFFGHRL
jgi:hypothetical protein